MAIVSNTSTNTAPDWKTLLDTWESPHTSTSGYPWAVTAQTAQTTYPDQRLLVDIISKLQERIRDLEKGLTSDKFDGVHDADLVLELIARGYVVHKPLEEVGNDAEGSATTTTTP